jgi:hypothetical protein
MLPSFPGTVYGQTAVDITKLLERLHDLNTIDLCKFEVRYRAGLEPSLVSALADESAMKILNDPREAQGQGKPGATGWYRVRFVIPDNIGKAKATTSNWVIESNIQGNAEIHAYRNGKPACLDREVAAFSNQSANGWARTMLLDAKAGDKIVLVILATSHPWGSGSPEGFALRHLRLGKRTSGAYDSFFAPLYSMRDKLQTLKGDELKALQAKVKAPLAGVDAVFAAAETGNVGLFIEAMVRATKPLSDALRK